jgi:ADP-ribose pyrophosphatase
VHRWFPRAEVEEMIRTGVITDDSSVAAYTLFLLSEPGDGGTAP